MTGREQAGTRIDALGIVVGTGCAVHCVLCSLAAPFLASLGMGGLLSPEIEWAATGLALILASVAAISGIRAHGSKLPASVLIGSGVGLVIARGLEHWELHWLSLGLGIVSGLGLVVGHISNRRVLASCGCTSSCA